MRAVAIGISLAALVAASAQAATFSDFLSFDAAVNITATEDFETLGNATTGFAGPWTGPSGIEVSTQSNNLFVAGPGQSSNTTTAIGSNYPGEDTLMVSLTNAVYAFGAEFFQNNGGGSQSGGQASFTMFTYLANMLVDTFTFTVDPNGGSYFGIQTTSLFNSVEIRADSGSIFEVADNVSIGDPGMSPVPLPASLPLLFAGLGGLAMLRRRQAQV